jgi:F-type H+-transporting ATPase subunit c
MAKKGVIGIFALVLVLGMASMVLAEDGAARAAGLWTFFGIAIACGFGIGVAALGTGLGMGHAINGALQGTARNPEAGGKIMTTMIIGLALIESLCWKPSSRLLEDSNLLRKRAFGVQALFFAPYYVHKFTILLASAQNGSFGLSESCLGHEGLLGGGTGRQC